MLIKLLQYITFNVVNYDYKLNIQPNLLATIIKARRIIFRFGFPLRFDHQIRPKNFSLMEYKYSYCFSFCKLWYLQKVSTLLCLEIVVGQNGSCISCFPLLWVCTSLTNIMTYTLTNFVYKMFPTIYKQ